MDTICGIGMPELIILALLGFILIGPERTREVALQAGRLLRKVTKSDLWTETQDFYQFVRDLPNRLMAMAEELEDVQSEVAETKRQIDKQLRFEDASPRTKPDTSRQEETIEDPWEIRNAVAQTTITPKPSPPTPTEDNDELHAQ
jgi:Sec-independent protein translocase protein TatA